MIVISRQTAFAVLQILCVLACMHAMHDPQQPLTASHINRLSQETARSKHRDTIRPCVCFRSIIPAASRCQVPLFDVMTRCVGRCRHSPPILAVDLPVVHTLITTANSKPTQWVFFFERLAHGVDVCFER